MVACAAPAALVANNAYGVSAGGSLEAAGAWYALRVRPNHERAVAHGLRERGLPEYLPVCLVRARWSDRIKTIARPLFPGYVFTSLVDEGAASSALQTAGVVCVVPVSAHPVAIPVEELETVQRVVNSRLPIEPDWPITAGDRVTIESGPLAGCAGVVVRERGKWRLIINVDLFGRAVAVELERAAVSKYAAG